MSGRLVVMIGCWVALPVGGCFDPASIGALRWSLRQATTGGAIVRFRTCDAVRACDAEPWTAVESGAIPAVTPRRFGQYQIELTGDGAVPTALDWIELAYRAR